MKALNLVWAVSSVLISLCAQADLMGKTVSVADGDTITILDASMTLSFSEVDCTECQKAIALKPRKRSMLACKSDACDGQIGAQNGHRGFPKAACQPNPGSSNWTAPERSVSPTSVLRNRVLQSSHQRPQPIMQLQGKLPTEFLPRQPI